MREFSLDNGIKCLLNDSDCKCHQSVSVVVMFGVGSRDEPRDFYGLTHFAEHMFFKGTVNRPEPEMIPREIDRYGGYMNAVTSYDTTYYFIRIDWRHLEVALDILSDMLFNSLFDQRKIDSEKEVVVNELKMYENDPSRLAYMLTSELVYSGTTLEHNIGGDIEKIRSATRNQFLTFVNHFYRPENTIVSIAGQIPGGFKSVKNLIAKYFDRKFNYNSMITKQIDTKNGSKFVARKMFPNFMKFQKSDRFLYRVKRDMDGSNMVLGFPGYKYLSHDYYTMLLISYILGKGMSSRLFIQVRGKRGLAYKISAFVESYQDIGGFYIQCATHGKDIKTTFKVIWAELQKVTNGDITEEELEFAKDHAIGEDHLARESTSNIAKSQAYDCLFFNRVISLNEFEKSVKSVKLSDINRVAKELFQKNKLNVVVVSNVKIDLKNGALGKNLTKRNKVKYNKTKKV